MIPARAASKLVVVMPATYGESRRRASTGCLDKKIGRRSGWNRALRGGKCNRPTLLHWGGYRRPENGNRCQIGAQASMKLGKCRIMERSGRNGREMTIDTGVISFY